MDSQDDRLWILGASDPEMEAIEGLLAADGEAVVYAVDSTGRRVRQSGAYTRPGHVVCVAGADGVLITPSAAMVYMVECDCGPVVRYGSRIVRIDHHRPGDPGYGRPPAEFIVASSIGQVVAALDLDYWTPDAYDDSGSEYAPRRARGFTSVWHHALSPEHMLVAAADHCLVAAYRGECPGVDSDALAAWLPRVASSV